jgi:general secretion pathway protein G
MEMMMVMAIIAILVGGVIGLLDNTMDDTKITKARGELQTLDASLLRYKTLAGRFPTAQQGLQALVTKPSSAPRPRDWSQIMKKLPLDPWGNPYIYKMPGTKDSTTYEILSYGINGTLGGDDDLSSQDDSQ